MKSGIKKGAKTISSALVSLETLAGYRMYKEYKEIKTAADKAGEFERFPGFIALVIKEKNAFTPREENLISTINQMFKKSGLITPEYTFELGENPHGSIRKCKDEKTGKTKYLLTLSYPSDKWLKNPKNKEMMLAIAGHELIHVLHCNADIFKFIFMAESLGAQVGGYLLAKLIQTQGPKLFKNPSNKTKMVFKALSMCAYIPLSSFLSYKFSQNKLKEIISAINKQFEYDADLSSVEQFNTAQGLFEFFRLIIELEANTAKTKEELVNKGGIIADLVNKLEEDNFDSHPDTKKRQDKIKDYVLNEAEARSGLNLFKEVKKEIKAQEKIERKALKKIFSF